MLSDGTDSGTLRTVPSYRVAENATIGPVGAVVVVVSEDVVVVVVVVVVVLVVVVVVGLGVVLVGVVVGFVVIVVVVVVVVVDSVVGSVVGSVRVMETVAPASMVFSSGSMMPSSASIILRVALPVPMTLNVNESTEPTFTDCVPLAVTPTTSKLLKTPSLKDPAKPDIFFPLTYSRRELS